MAFFICVGVFFVLSKLDEKLDAIHEDINNQTENSFEG